ncbi:MAG TPA: hypothetical protein VLA49_05350 [Anaerolineales bacterium]|nr:hypothetical protein [Anaerolineales bacterium]
MKNSNKELHYEIRVAAHLDDAHASEFGGLSMTRLPEGETLISGRVVDQAALFGILLRIRDWGFPLVSVKRTTRSQHEPKIKRIKGEQK